MAYPVLTKADLALFSGRAESEYTDYADQALIQARLLFKIGTCLPDFPEGADDAELARMAILAMADAIVLAQPYQTIVSNPFNSETIGSYSYSKTAGAVTSGLPTGITWFDLAIKELSACGLTGTGSVGGGGIEVFEGDGYFGRGQTHEGNVKLFTLAELQDSRRFGWDPSGRYGFSLHTEVEIDFGDLNQDGGLLGG